MELVVSLAIVATALAVACQDLTEMLTTLKDLMVVTSLVVSRCMSLSVLLTDCLYCVCTRLRFTIGYSHGIAQFIMQCICLGLLVSSSRTNHKNGPV